MFVQWTHEWQIWRTVSGEIWKIHKYSVHPMRRITNLLGPVSKIWRTPSAIGSVRTTMRRAGLEILVVKYDSQVRCQLEDNEGRMMGTLWQSIWLHREKCSDSILHVEGFEGCNAGKEGKLMTYAMKRVTAGAL